MDPWIEVDAATAAQETLLHNDRFDAIAAELARLAAEIAVINRQPFDTRIDLRMVDEVKQVDEVKADRPLIQINDWKLHR